MKYVKMLFEILAESKKARALIVGLLALALIPVSQKVGLEVDEALIEKGVMLIAAYLLGQGLADLGKEKAKVEAGEKSPGVEGR